GLAAVETQRADRPPRVAHGERRELRDRPAREADGAWAGVEPLPAAGRARLLGGELVEPGSLLGPEGFPQDGEGARKVARPLQDEAPLACGEARDRPLERHAGRGERAQQAPLLRAPLRQVPRQERAGRERARRIEDQRGIDVDEGPRPVARRAGALTAVEGEETRVEAPE